MIRVVLHPEFYGFHGEHHIFCHWCIVEWTMLCKFIEETEIHPHKKRHKRENKVEATAFFTTGHDAVFKVVPNLNRYQICLVRPRTGLMVSQCRREKTLKLSQSILIVNNADFQVIFSRKRFKTQLLFRFALALRATWSTFFHIGKSHCWFLQDEDFSFAWISAALWFRRKTCSFQYSNV